LDVKSLEERGLLGTHTGVLLGYDDGQRGDGTSTSRGFHLIIGDSSTDVVEVTLGEDETDVAFEARQQLLETGVVLDVTTDGLSHHGVLTEQQSGVTEHSQVVTDALHLLATDIVSVDDETLVIFIQILNKFEEVGGLPGCFVYLDHRGESGSA